MSLKDFSKQQKQYAILGLLAVATLVILITLGIRFSMGTISTAKVELNDLTAKIGSAEKALSKSQQTSEEYVETVGMLREYLTNVPPERNCYSWATEVIYSKSRLANIEIDSIEELSLSQLRRAAPTDGEATVSFESYSVRIAAHGGYENAKYFLRLFEKDYPLVRFSGLEISVGKNPESHDIQLYMQWPYNFGDVTNNWDVVSSKSRQAAAVNDGKEIAAPREPAPEPAKEPASPAPSVTKPEPAKEPASPVPSVTKPEPVNEPYPPTTRPKVEEAPAPKVEEAPAPKAIVEPTAPEPQNGVSEAEAYVESSSVDAALQPATLSGAEDLPADEAPPIAESEEADPQLAVAEPESIVHEQSASEPETVAEPVAVIEPQAVAVPELVVEPQPQDEPSSDPAPQDTMDQDLLQMMDAFETTNAAVTGPPADEAVEEVPLMDSSSTSNRWLPSSVGSQSGSETVSNDVETGKSEQINEEAGSKDSTRKGSLWGRFFGGDRKGESNEE